MAQQTLDFVIAQQVTGQAEVAKLINSVGALQAEMSKLRAATSSIGGSFNQASQAIRGNTNVLDAQSKALRNQRQGMQQAGMQVNDFVTSISTGASPVQAFNQQIGQLGYAMSSMGGVAGRIGTFLAGPWSIAVIGASMALGFLADKFFESGDEAEKASAKTEEYTEISYAQKMASESLIGVTDELNRLSGRYTVTVEQQAAATIEAAKAKIVETQKTLDLAIAQAALNEERLKGYRLTQQIQGVGAGGDGGRAAAGGTGFLAGRAETTLEQTKARIEGLRKQLGTARGALEYLEKNGPKAAGGADRASSSVRGLGRAAGSQREEMSELEKQLQRLTEKYAPQIGALEVARVAYERGMITLRQYNAELAESLGLSDKSLRLEPFKLPNDFEQQWSKMTDPKPIKSYDENVAKVTERLIAHRDAVQSVGQTVASGFQGMITGARSFGDVMKSVIESVISELFRLFVVQKIVGMVSNAISPTLKSIDPILKVKKGLAMGGSAAQNQPYLVGERGPELFVPGKSGTVIPTQNTKFGGGSNMIINVDARGATSPEMVRQQVQQGILEAAPSIVAAAEQRTITTLRRPRLAGAL